MKFFLALLFTNIAMANSPVGVEKVDLNAYQGTWKAVAIKRGALFQKLCYSETSAIYTLNEAGNVNVVNSCKSYLFFRSSVNGTAYSKNTPKNSELYVDFSNKGNGGKPNYFILGIEETKYHWVVVSDDSFHTVWVMMRDEREFPQFKDEILQLLEKFSLNSCQFRMEPQPNSPYKKGGKLCNE